MNRNIIVVDDFHDNPDEIRKIALELEYPTPHDGYTYPGRNSRGEYYPDSLHKKFESILNRKLTPANPNGYFRLSLESDEFRQDIHVDPVWQFGAVCYLNTPDQCIPEGGTSFWIHNNTGMDTLLDTDEKAKIYGYPSKREHWHTTVYSEGLNRSKWTRYLLSPMKYNRVVIFRSNLWHSHNYNFGTNLNNGRLVQLFFFNPINWFE